MTVLDSDTCYRAIAGRDARFDGWFFVGVTSTGIFCRPSCPARTPKRANVRFFGTAAAAAAAGFRACLRCRPDTTPGSPEWNVRSDVVARGMRLIADGVVDEQGGVARLANRLGYSTRQLTRLFTEELGVGPLAVARTQRAATARTLIETTRLGFAEITFAAGFTSVRQFNDTIREFYGRTPSQLRDRRSAGRGHSEHGTDDLGTPLTLRLATRQPFDASTLLDFLRTRAVSGIEVGTTNSYRRTVPLPHGPAIIELTPTDSYVRATLHLADWRDLATAVARCRRLFDLDADPTAIDAATSDLGGPAGLRLPGTVDPWELAVRAILGQQVSVAGARTTAHWFVTTYGKPLPATAGALTHTFPDAQTLAAADPTGWPIPAARARSIGALANAVADGRITLDVGTDARTLAAELASSAALPGIGSWTANYIAMRALGDPDVFLATDLGIRRAARHRGLPDEPRALTAYAERWRPFRSYATLHLWTAEHRH